MLIQEAAVEVELNVLKAGSGAAARLQYSALMHAECLYGPSTVTDKLWSCHHRIWTVHGICGYKTIYKTARLYWEIVKVDKYIKNSILGLWITNFIGSVSAHKATLTFNMSTTVDPVFPFQLFFLLSALSFYSSPSQPISPSPPACHWGMCGQFL